MKILLVVICLILLPSFVNAQQIGVNSLYHNTISYYNPAYTASEYQLRGGLQYRRQWSGFNGAPVSYFGQYEQNFDAINSGIGINFTRNEVAFSTFQTALINYRYEVKLSRINRLSFGISGGANNGSFNPFWLSYDPNDYLLPGKEAQTKFVLNVGTQLKLNRFSVGLSALQINRPNFDRLHFRSKIHSVFTIDYKWLITRKFNLEPSLFWITDTKYMSLTTLLRANYNNKFWGMAGYRFDDGIVFGAGVIISERFSLGYNLDVITSKLSNVVTYTHGVYFNFQIKRPPVFPLKLSGTPDF